jgi:hypothetical protein
MFFAWNIREFFTFKCGLGLQPPCYVILGMSVDIGANTWRQVHPSVAAVDRYNPKLKG